MRGPRDDLALRFGQGDLASADLMVERVLQAVLLEGVGMGFGPEVARVRRGAAELELDQVIELEASGRPSANAVGAHELGLQWPGVAGRWPHC
jgi:hypothetical protein